MSYRHTKPPPQWWELMQKFSSEALGRYIWEKWQGRYAGALCSEIMQQRRKMQIKSKNKEYPMAQAIVEPEIFPYGSMRNVHDENPSAIAFKSVEVTGEVRGLLFSSTIRQTYKNETSKPLEVIYTFPLAWDTALLGMSASMDGKHLHGEIVEKHKAEQKYETAILSGDSAIMVEMSAKGLCTANLGNIKAGETVSVELHCARMLRMEQNRVRLNIPTVISERYGDAHGPGGLADHETEVVSPAAHYSFGVHVTLYGQMAKGKVSCPSHGLQAQSLPDGGLSFGIEGPAALDRDFILLIEDVVNDSHAQCVTEGEETLVAASFVPTMPDDTAAPLACKILLDCSGSMGGERIEQGIQGLRKVCALFREGDYVSYTRFGSDVHQIFGSMLPCTKQTLGQFSEAIDKTYADMGGTEMGSALAAVYQIESPAEMPAGVLLITDGDIWDVEGVIAQARKSGQRVFAIGVGASPAESLLRELAEKTGGACELVTPRENMADAIVRMFARMRQGYFHNVRIDWQGETLWKTKTPRYLYRGETLHCFALMRGGTPSAAPVLHWQADGGDYAAMAEGLEMTSTPDLFRLAMMRRLEEANSSREKKELALKYKLMSKETSLILVYERPDGEKITMLPTVQKTPQMPAHKRTPFVQFCSGVAACLAEPLAGICASAPSRKMASRLAEEPLERELNHCFSPRKLLLSNLDNISACEDDGLNAVEEDAVEEHIAVRFRTFVAQYADKMSSLSSVQDVQALVQKGGLMDDVQNKLTEIQAGTNRSMEELWSIFVLWLIERHTLKVDRHSLRNIRFGIRNISTKEIVTVKALLDDWTRP
ncbi:MAG: VWA domain-containing protein [Desulfovibrio sp.]|nr:VWA domain-containing protein [Desulfovibrio sp.]